MGRFFYLNLIVIVFQAVWNFILCFFSGWIGLCSAVRIGIWCWCNKVSFIVQIVVRRLLVALASRLFKRVIQSYLLT